MRRPTIKGGGKQRFLLFSDPKAGKSWTLCKIIDDLLRTGARFYVIDPEDSFEQSSSEFDQTAFDQVVEWFVPGSYTEVKQAFKECEAKILARYEETGKIQDWLMIDGVSELWELTQVDYVRTIWGDDLGDRYLKLRREIEDKIIAGETTDMQPKLDGWSDWAQIKKLHNTDLVDRMKRLPCNWVITAQVKELMKDNPRSRSKIKEHPTIKEMFGELGKKPEGEKSNAHRVDYVIYLVKDTHPTLGTKYKMQFLGGRGMQPFEAEIPLDSSAYHVWVERKFGL